jgi:hypothetical protein
LYGSVAVEIMMKQILSFLVLLIFVSCGTISATETPAVVVTTTIIPTNTELPPTSIPSITPSITPTLKPACDPLRVDYCVIEGRFLLRRPIQPPANDLIDPIYGYGSTASGTREPHHGVEFSNPTGTPVHTAAEGTVIFAGPDEEAVYAPWADFYGNLVVIEHGGDLFTLYAHLSKIDVLVGQKVLAGDKIGEVGRSGGAIGSHLHFEVRRGDVEHYFATQNPELWLTLAKDQTGNFFGALMISVIDGAGNLVKNVNFTIGYYSDPAQGPNRSYYATSYSPDLLLGEENAVLGGLPPGQYRIAVEMNGMILERWVEVESGRLTQVVFVVK